MMAESLALFYPELFAKRLTGGPNCSQCQTYSYSMSTGRDEYLGYWGGIMITASHNPPQYNGIKPIAHDGIEISRETSLMLKTFIFQRNFLNVMGWVKNSLPSL